MAPILYYTELSPPVRAVLLTAKAIGLELDLRNIDVFKQEHLTPEYLKMNPQHSIPTLDDNGFIFWDSHAINAYLVGKYAKDDSLYPKDLQKRAIIDQRLHFDSGILFPGLINIFFPIRMGATGISQEKIDAVHNGYDLADKLLEGKKYFAGEQLTLADFSAVSSISSISTVVPFGPGKYPNVLRWMETMKKLPYYQEANGNGAEAIGKLAKEMMETNKYK